MVGEHGRLRILRIGPGGIEFGIGIDEHEQVATAQDELVDRVLRILGKFLRMHEHEHVDVGIDRFDAGRVEVAHVEGLRELLLDRPRIAHLPRLRIEADAHRQARDKGDRRLLRRGQIMDQLGHVVFEEGFLFRLEERNDRLAVGRVGSGQAEEDGLAAGADRHRLQAVGRGPVLVFGERQRVDDLELDVAVRTRRHLLEQLAHARRIGAQLRQVLRALVGIEKIQVDRFVELGKDFLGARRQRVEVVLGEVDAGAAEQHVDDEHEGDEQDDHDDQGAAGESLAIG